jgi:DNA (cytosine-5)-methyltransferase 1
MKMRQTHLFNTSRGTNLPERIQDRAADFVKIETKTAIGLFAGIGGIELGLQKAGWKNEVLCEIDPAACAVLSKRFTIPVGEILKDVREIKKLPQADLLAGGFPCQDLSQAGKAGGIHGKKSGLVGELFRLLKSANPTWFLIENVPFMLQLDKGKAMDVLTSELEKRGFSWAYRVVNTHSFGIPHRRKRVIMIASKFLDPRGILLNQDDGEPTDQDEWSDHANGFYWTEGLRGIGWAVNSVPPLKCGSTISIPSPPAIWLPDGTGKHSFITPTVSDAERLQGFPRDWTNVFPDDKKFQRARWRMLGNAVSVPVAEWVAKRLSSPVEFELNHLSRRLTERRWPSAAWGSAKDGRFEVPVSAWPHRKTPKPLISFIKNIEKCPPLSKRAPAGFLSRFEKGSLRAGGARVKLIKALKQHVKSFD